MMRDEQLLFWIAFGCVLLIGGIALYLARRVDKLEREIRELRNPFQGLAFFGVPRFHQNTLLRMSIKFARINVVGMPYTQTMKKRKAPLNKIEQATRNAHSAELFKSLMLNKHLVVTPATRKGSRQSNIRKAINESL